MKKVIIKTRRNTLQSLTEIAEYIESTSAYNNEIENIFLALEDTDIYISMAEETREDEEKAFFLHIAQADKAITKARTLIDDYNY